MERIIKIALAGRKYSGKDEFAELFEELGFHIFSFSDQLKRIATNLFPFMKKDYTSKEKESLVVYTNPDTGVEYTPRDIWQALDLLPEIYPPVFVESMSNEVLNLAAKKRQVLKRCVKDVRRPAELEWISKTISIYCISTLMIHEVPMKNRSTNLNRFKR